MRRRRRGWSPVLVVSTWIAVVTRQIIHLKYHNHLRSGSVFGIRIRFQKAIDYGSGSETLVATSFSCVRSADLGGSAAPAGQLTRRGLTWQVGSGRFDSFSAQVPNLGKNLGPGISLFYELKFFRYKKIHKISTAHNVVFFFCLFVVIVKNIV